MRVEFEAVVMSVWGVLVIRAGEDAAVAAEKEIIDFFGEVRRYGRFVFDGEVTDALFCVECAVGGECVCGAGFYTFVAL